MLASFTLLILFGLPHNYFTKFDKDNYFIPDYNYYVEPNIIVGNLLQDKKIILYGDPTHINPYKRFYNNYKIILGCPIKEDNLDSFEYVVQTPAINTNKTHTENVLGLNLELTYAFGAVNVYKIKR